MNNVNALDMSHIDICQRLRRRKNWVCPGGMPPPLQLSYALPCTVVASFGLRHLDTPHFLVCVYADADAHIDPIRVPNYFSNIFISFLGLPHFTPLGFC